MSVNDKTRKIGSLWLHVPSDMKKSIICNDYMIPQQQETLLWNKYHATVTIHN